MADAGTFFGPADANRFLAALSVARSEPTTAQMAKIAAERLLACYPERQVTDPKVYVATLVHVLMAYPWAVVKHMTDPVTGLPSRLKFFPSIADVSTALREFDEALRKRAGEAGDLLVEQPKYLKREPPEPPKTEEEKQRVKAMAEEFLGRPVNGAIQKYKLSHKRENIGMRKPTIDVDQLMKDHAYDLANAPKGTGRKEG